MYVYVVCVYVIDFPHDSSTDHPQMWPPVTGTLAPYDHPFNHQMNPQMPQSHPPPYHHCECVCVCVCARICHMFVCVCACARAFLFMKFPILAYEKMVGFGQKSLCLFRQILRSVGL